MAGIDDAVDELQEVILLYKAVKSWHIELYLLSGADMFQLKYSKKFEHFC